MKKYKLLLIALSVMGLSFSQAGFCAINTASGKTTATSKSTLSFSQIKMAAENGDADAQYALGYMFYYGKGGAPKDASLAKTWIGKAAAQKQSQAVKAIALMNGKQSYQGEQKVDTQATQADNSYKHEESSLAASKEPEEKKQVISDKELSDKEAVKTEKMSLVDMRHKRIIDKTAKTVEENTIVAKSPSEGKYTLQLLGASNKDAIRKLVKDHHLNQVKIYKTTFNKKDWYVLLQGQYQTKSQAQIAAKKLEAELSLKPWIKPYSNVKQYKVVES